MDNSVIMSDCGVILNTQDSKNIVVGNIQVPDVVRNLTNPSVWRVLDGEGSDILELERSLAVRKDTGIQPPSSYGESKAVEAKHINNI